MKAVVAVRQQAKNIDVSLVGQTVSVSGWVQRRRDHGGVIFLDVRDPSGLVQAVVNPDDEAAFAVADACRNEYVIRVTGGLRARPEGTVNRELATGEVEIVAHEVEMLSRSEPLPFAIDGKDEPSEEVRLRYRYLDLRRSEMNQRLRERAAISREVRHFLETQECIEVETPILTQSTPSGARDYLVPSRIHHGHAFALPQSPQLFKQLLMIGGIGRYYQIARCFRDEDPRADRQPDFTQIDIELSFVNQTEIQQLGEGLIRHLFKTRLGVEFGAWPTLPYSEAMELYGTDAPDLRNPLKLVEVKDLMANEEFVVFARPAKDPNSRVCVMRAPGELLTRSRIDAYTKFVQTFGAKGLAWMRVESADPADVKVQSPIAKFLSKEAIEGVVAKAEAQDGDVLFFGAGPSAIVCDSMARLRDAIAEDLSLLTCEWAPVWIVDFPLFEKNGEGRVTSCHHPFTAPQGEMDGLMSGVFPYVAQAYDIVLNGSELGGGSIRIHDQPTQAKVFELLGMDEAQAKDQFGALMSALKFGTPPHGGIAFGLDRIVSQMTGATSIRDVIAFPKTQSGTCLLTRAPSPIDPDVWSDYGLKPRVPPA